MVGAKEKGYCKENAYLRLRRCLLERGLLSWKLL